MAFCTIVSNCETRPLKENCSIENTIEPRNSGKFGLPDFFRYCGVFRYLAGYPPHPKKSHYENILSLNLILKIKTHIILKKISNFSLA